MLTRSIPSSNEALPVIGCGTYVGFDTKPGSKQYQGLNGVLQALIDAGGRVLDSSPMYGRAEAALGGLLAESGMRDKAFVATKVWTNGREAGIRQMQESMKLLQTETIDLMQIHNLVDWRAHLGTLQAWKEQGRIRYIGITHYTASAHDQLEAVMQSESIDFVQLNYSLDDRDAQKRLLPVAAERGIAVLVNRPFGGGELLRRLNHQPLPAWAADIGAASWAQLLLKFVLSQPAVTCIIPGTGRAAHMADDVQAAAAEPPPPGFWETHYASLGVD
jgi:diketogulonate reductase-like aldo/keto reductase